MASRVLFLFLFLQLCTWIGAVEFARVCQSDNVYAPFVNDCKGYKDAVNKAHPDGLIIQTNVYASCQVIYKSGSCAIDVCAFPSQGLNATGLFSTVDDILNNCSKQPPGKGSPITGGYNIILNTNITVGVLGTATPYQIKATSTNSSSPLQSDCVNAYNSISSSQNYTQASASNCTILLTSGTCQIGFCDTQGAVVSGIELQDYVRGLLFGTIVDLLTPARSSGYIQISDKRRISMFSNQRPTAVSSNEIHCRTYSDNKPKQTDCAGAWDAIQKANPWGYQLTQANAECTTLANNGACQIDLCGSGTSSIATGTMKQAFLQINSTCKTDASTMGGFARIAGSDMILSVSSSDIPKNIFCNTAPNNSPKYAECGPAINALRTNSVYKQNSELGCTIVSQNGACKLNYCGPVGSAVSGRDLANWSNNIMGTCFSGQYASGIYQINPSTSVGMYDPDNLLSQGVPVCDTSDSSPSYTDCIKAVNQLIFTNPTLNCQNNSPKGDSSCTSVATVGSCQIQVCGQAAEPFSCFSIGAKADLLMQSCSNTAKIGGRLGLRNAYYGDTLLQIISSGPTSKRELLELPERSANVSELTDLTLDVKDHNSLEKRVLPPEARAIAGTALYFVFAAPILPIGVVNRVPAPTRTGLRNKVKAALASGASLVIASVPFPGYSETWEAWFSTYGDTATPQAPPPSLANKLVSANDANGAQGTSASNIVGLIVGFLHDSMDQYVSAQNLGDGKSTDTYDGRILDANGLDVCLAHLGNSFTPPIPNNIPDT